MNRVLTKIQTWEKSDQSRSISSCGGVLTLTIVIGPILETSRNHVYNRWNSKEEAMSWSNLCTNVNVILFSHLCSQGLMKFGLHKNNFQLGQQGIYG